MSGVSLGFRNEIARKLVHFTGLAVPVIYFFTSRRLAVQVLAVLAATSVALDFLRRYHGQTGKIFNKIFDPILRSHERERRARNLNAVSWFFIAATISAAIFPKYITIMSITISLFGDAASALIGNRFGSRRFNGKSLEGSAAFLIIALIIVIITPKIEYSGGEYMIGLIAVMVGTVAELITVKVLDDNLTVPLSIAFTMWALYKAVFPQMNLQFGG